MAGVIVSRQDLDARLHDVAIAVRNTLDNGSMAAHLSGWLANTTQEVLEAAPYSYTADEAYAVKLFGDDLRLLMSAWTGTAVAALSPAPAAIAAEFTGLD